MDILFGFQWFPVAGKKISNSKELEGFSKFLPVGLDLNFPGLEYLLHSSLTLLLPQGWEEAPSEKGPHYPGVSVGYTSQSLVTLKFPSPRSVEKDYRNLADN